MQPTWCAALTAIVGMFDLDSRFGVSDASRALGRMAWRGSRPARVIESGHAVLGAARHPWVSGIAPKDGAPISEEEGTLVAFDGSLYHRGDLLRALEGAGEVARSPGDPALVLAAYRAWGSDLGLRLEGDFAAVLWDARRRRAVCVRSSMGQRPLCFVELGDRLIVASTVSGALAHPDVPRRLNRARLGACASGLISVSLYDTAYEGVEHIPAASTLTWSEGRAAHRVHWNPGREAGLARLSEEDAARELARRLQASVIERMAATGTTAMWMSGGYDSPAVYASGCTGLAADPAGRSLQPISMVFPADDPGNEDEFVSAIARHWGARVEYVASDAIDWYQDLSADARDREDPFRAEFSGLHRGLSEASVRMGARVAFTGAGGDQVFDGSFAYWADLLRAAKLRTLRDEWRAWRKPGGRFFYRWALKPLIPRGLYPFIGLLRGGKVPLAEFARPISPILDRKFVRVSGLEDRERSAAPSPASGSTSLGEQLWYTTGHMMPRFTAHVTDTALRAGVDLRHPLLDRRLIELALSRPMEERRWAGEGKRLLRRAMRDRLPASVLAGRTKRTGSPVGIFVRWATGELPVILARLQSEGSALVDLGIVDRGALATAAEQVGANSKAYGKALQLYHFVQTELWVRQRLDSPD